MVKAEGEYFYKFETELLSEITWEEMVKEGKIISPSRSIKILQQAKKFLITAPGPNLERRKVLVPEWLDYWTSLLKLRTLKENYLFDPPLLNQIKLRRLTR